MPRAKREIIYRYPNGEVFRWRPGTYDDAGILNVPIYHDPEINAELVERKGVASLRASRQNRRIEEDRKKRMAALFHYFGIEEADDEADAWKSLAAALIEEHVPGFQVTTEKVDPVKKRGRGRPRNPRSSRKDYVGAIDSMRKHLEQNRRSATIPDAIRMTMKRRPDLFKTATGREMSAATAKREYYRRKESIDRWKNSALRKLMNLPE